MSDATMERELAQCQFETEIARKLRSATRAERMHLYGELYETYAQAFPESIPRHEDDADPSVGYEFAFARRFVAPPMVVGEIGPGRCELAYRLAPYCGQFYAFDVVNAADPTGAPGNFTHVVTDGIHVPLSDGQADVVVSNQVMEHLHPDDALDQLREVARVLRPGGRYLCMTPNRLHGPHDSSARFDALPCPVANGSYVANGLHLKEYTNTELAALLHDAGFRRCAMYVGARGHYVRVPAGMMQGVEALVRLIPLRWRKRSRLLQPLLGVRMVAER